MTDTEKMDARMNPFKCGFGDFCQDDGCLENEWGNNAEPLTNLCYDDNHRVCDLCNQNVVIPARMYNAQGKTFGVGLMPNENSHSQISYKILPPNPKYS